MRNNIAIAMVCMVNQFNTFFHDKQLKYRGITNLLVPWIINFLTAADHGTQNSSGQCPNHQTDTAHEYKGELAWNAVQQGVVFSAYFWGAFVSGFPAGYFADRYGPKKLMLVCLSLNVAGSLAFPTLALYWGVPGAFVVRFLMGIGGGIVNPVAGALTARWHLAEEKGRVGTIVTGGNQLAAIVIMPLGSQLCKANDWLPPLSGWPSIFYVPALFGALFMVVWMVFVSDTPSKSNRISYDELQHIESSVSLHLQGRKDGAAALPWASLLTSPALLATALGYFAMQISIVVFSTYLPTYFMQILCLDITSNGFLSALPFMTQLVSKYILSFFSDALRKRTSLTPNFLSKAFNSLAAFGGPTLLLLLYWTGRETAWAAVLLLCLSTLLRAGNINGIFTTTQSLAPQYAGLVNSICEFTAQIGGLLMPCLVGAIVEKYAGLVNSICRVTGQTGALLMPFIVGAIVQKGTRDEWEAVFLILTATNFLAGSVFIVFGSVEVQEWAKPKQKTSISSVKYES